MTEAHSRESCLLITELHKHKALQGADVSACTHAHTAHWLKSCAAVCLLLCDPSLLLPPPPDAASWMLRQSLIAVSGLCREKGEEMEDVALHEMGLSCGRVQNRSQLCQFEAWPLGL